MSGCAGEDMRPEVRGVSHQCPAVGPRWRRSVHSGTGVVTGSPPPPGPTRGHLDEASTEAEREAAHGPNSTSSHPSVLHPAPASHVGLGP